MKIIFEAHATTLDNEAGVCSGWNDVALSALGEQQALELGKRYRLDDFDAIFCADLQRAYMTAQLAFPNIPTTKLFLDWRLRECDYGDLTLAPKQQVEAEKVNRIKTPFPNGESYDQAMMRLQSFIEDLKQTDYNRIMVVGSRATHYGLDHWITGKSLEELVQQQMIWRPGWEYELN